MIDQLASYLNEHYFAGRDLVDEGAARYVVEECARPSLYKYYEESPLVMELASVQVPVTRFVAYLFDPAQPQADALRRALNETLISYRTFCDTQQGRRILARQQGCTRQLARLLSRRIYDFTAALQGRNKLVFVFATELNLSSFFYKTQQYEIGVLVRCSVGTLQRNAAQCGIEPDALTFHRVPGAACAYTGGRRRQVTTYCEDGYASAHFVVDTTVMCLADDYLPAAQAYNEQVYVHCKKRKLKALARL